MKNNLFKIWKTPVFIIIQLLIWVFWMIALAETLHGRANIITFMLVTIAWVLIVLYTMNEHANKINNGEDNDVQKTG